MADAEHSKCFSERSAGSSPAFGTMTMATLIFDGDCGFCTTAASWAVRHSKVPIHSLPWQFTDVTRFGLLIPQAQAHVWLVVGEEKFRGHEAIAKWLILQPNKLYKAAGQIMFIPPFCFIFAGLYRMVARFRHKLPGGTPACKLPGGQVPNR